MFLNLPGIVFQPISADVTRQTIKEHFLLRYGIKLLAHTGLTCSDATCEMSRQPTLGWFTGTIEYYNAKLKEYKVNYLDNTSDFVSPDDFDGVEVILEQL